MRIPDTDHVERQRQARDRVVVDLADWRTRRLLAPWPGYWAGREMATWSWAERTVRPA